ncbi:hypothetical protein LCGC14_1208180 [marine sediment metagenome]|uniref:Uncharacterized protein n=1 Tax=marine sediment metagenome TaxID=412755 RepID=A0A0F9PJK2_9ZZZZ
MRLKRVEPEIKKSSPWWWRVPVILVCGAVIFTIIVFGKVVSAASGMPEFGEILANNLNALKAFWENNLEILRLIW